MRLFGRERDAGSWLAVGVYGQRIDVAQVERVAVGRPAVQICESYARKGSEVDALKSVARAVRPGRFHCSAMLEAADYQIQLVEAPNVPREEIRSAVRWKLKDLLDYPADAATVDVAHVPTDPSGTARAHYVHVVSARNERVASRMKLFRDAKFPLEAIDIPEMAQRNIARLYEEPGRGLALLAFDDLGGLLTVTADGELFMARHTDVSAAQLTGVRSDMTDPTVERLVLELQRSLDHFDRQFSHVSVARMLLAPLPADIDLDRHLASSLGLPVDSLDLTEVLDFSGAPELRDPTRQGYRLHIIGAALRERRMAS